MRDRTNHVNDGRLLAILNSEIRIRSLPGVELLTLFFVSSMWKTIKHWWHLKRMKLRFCHCGWEIWLYINVHQSSMWFPTKKERWTAWWNKERLLARNIWSYYFRFRNKLWLVIRRLLFFHKRFGGHPAKFWFTFSKLWLNYRHFNFLGEKLPILQELFC